MDLACQIKTVKAKKQEIAIFWLGQAGFVFKDSEDHVVAIDPYLTDCVERLIGFKRLTPKMIAPEELELDLLIATHDHFDHFDIDAVPLLMSNGRTRLAGSPTVIRKCIEMGIAQNQLVAMKPGDETALDDINVQAVEADHGELAPDALGILLNMAGIKTYFAGDTAYHPRIIEKAAAIKPDVVIVPINGQYGNLNPEEAAKLVCGTGAKTAIPCHFWTFAMHRGDPQEFTDQMNKYAPDCQVKFMHQGEMLKYSFLEGPGSTRPNK